MKVEVDTFAMSLFLNSLQLKGYSLLYSHGQRNLGGDRNPRFMLEKAQGANSVRLTDDS